MTQTSSHTVQQLFHSVCTHAEYIPDGHGEEMMWVRQHPHFFINFFHMGAIFCFFPAILMLSTHFWQEQPLFPMNEHAFPIRYIFPATFKESFFELSFPTAIRLMDDHTHFVQEVPRDLQCLPMSWAIYVVEDACKHLDIPILSNLGASSNFT